MTSKMKRIDFEDRSPFELTKLPNENFLLDLNEEEKSNY